MLDLSLAERVAAGGFVAIVGDRTPVQGGRSVTADFLGHRAPFQLPGDDDAAAAPSVPPARDSSGGRAGHDRPTHERRTP